MAGVEVQGQVLVRQEQVQAPAGAVRYQVAAHAGINYLVPTELKGKEYRVEEDSGTVYFVTEAGRFPGTPIDPEENRALRAADISALIRLAVIYLAVIAVGFVFHYGQFYLLNKTGQQIIFDLRHHVFSHLQQMSLRFFDTNPVGRLITRVTNDTEVLSELFTDVLVNMFKDIFTLAGIVLVMLRMNARLALLSFALLPLVIAATFIYRTMARKAYREVRVRLARINAFLQESISGMRIIQIFHQEKRKFDDFEKINRAHLRASLGNSGLCHFRPFLNSYAAGVALLIWIGGGDVLRAPSNLACFTLLSICQDVL